MGKRDKKTGKGRLDKYYRLAKEQGYRARSAFKLIQLNKRYQFLESARSCIDLCAAPGGWLQVAAKWMPPNSLILGVDLVAIKPIPRVVTATEDITTESCRHWLRSELRDWKADVVLHDGAPNVGTAWIQDAFTQAELVLHSLRLAVEMLAPNGTFVTKIFRSKDYTSLLYVFNQFFRTVEATKPPSSRNVSAEIFVVCQGFKAPKKVDPRLLDPAEVFKDLDLVRKSILNREEMSGDGENGQTAVSTTSAMKLNTQAQNVFHPEKRRRARDGYDEDDYTLHHTTTAVSLLKAVDPVTVLGTCNVITFPRDTADDIAVRKLRCLDDELKQCCQDLKVLGKGDFKKLLKWRIEAREALGWEIKKSASELNPKDGGEVVVEPIDSDTEMAVELDRINNETAAKNKRERRRVNAKRTRDLQRMQLSMTTPMELGLERKDDEVFALEMDVPVDEAVNEDDSVTMQGDDASHSFRSIDESMTSFHGHELDDDDMNTLQQNLDDEYSAFQESILEKDAKRKVREESRRKRHALEGDDDEWGGVGDGSGGSEEEDVEDDIGDPMMTRNQEESESGDDTDWSEGEDVTKEAERIMAARQGATFKKRERKPQRAPKDTKAQQHQESTNNIWFDQPVFAGLDLPGADTSDEEDDEATVCEGDEDQFLSEEEAEQSGDEIHDEEKDDESDFEIVPLEEKQAVDQWNDDTFDHDAATQQIIQEKGLLTAEQMQMAMDLVNRKTTTSALVDSGFHRTAYQDTDGVPTWFADDEQRHFRQHIPVTKEAVQALRSRQRELNARPIKKVAEAKGRKKLRALRRLEKAKDKANAVEGSGDLTEREKAGQIEKLMNRVMKAGNGGSDGKKGKREIKVVVAKGSSRGVKGRPKGVKGRYKMVDSRGKKELRAQKRAAINNKKTGRRR